MESKIIKYKDSEFTFVYDESLLKKKKNRLLKKYFSLEKEFTGDIDRTILDNYEKRIAELELGIESTKDESHRTELESKLAKFQTAFDNDLKAKAVQREITQCTGLLMTELCEDTDFIKPFLKEVLQGDLDKVEYGTQAANVFILEVINSFFSFTVPNS